MSSLRGGTSGDPDLFEVDSETVAGPLLAAQQAPRALRLRVVEGPDKGTSFTLSPSSPSRVYVGTGPACELRLTDPTVSRRHFAIEPAGRRFKVTDLGSTNGTFVDGVAIIEGFVGGGEVVRAGGSGLRLETERAGAAPPLSSASKFGHTIGVSAAMRRLYPLCERVAASSVSTLLEGETGTGKEVLAESIHEVGGSSGPFVVFDCTTIAPNLLAAELFGHERGAFTGAVSSRAGLFEQAHGGTLFIDEIGDFDVSLQPALLRAIDRGEVRRVGGKQGSHFDVRIIAATRRDLDKEVQAGRFRDDLFHRLAVARIELPPLRERKGDVTMLARHFAEMLRAPPDALPPSLLATYEDYSWPGNIRELRNAVMRRVALGDFALETHSSGPGPASEPPPASGSPARTAASWLDPLLAMNDPFPVARRKVLAEFERRYVQRVLDANDGNVARAAAASGIALRYFQQVKARQAGHG